MEAKNKCKIVIIDGQGGKIGRQLVSALCNCGKDIELHAVGTNSIATENMLKGGADFAATGENAVLVACRTANIITGPLGIVVADALHGEVTPAMAVAVGQNTGKKVLIPIDKCGNVVAGTEGLSVGELVQKAVRNIIESID